PDPARAVLGAGHAPPVGEQAPRGARGGQPRHHLPPRPGEAPLPQRGAHQRDRRALDHPLRAGPRARARRPQESTGGHRRGKALVRLHDLHQDHPGAPVAGPDRARLHRALLGPDVRNRLAGRLADALATARHHDRRRRAGRGRVRPVPPAVVHLAHVYAGVGRRAGGRRRDPRAPRRRAALEGDLRHRAARRRAGEAHRRPRRPRAGRPHHHDDQRGLAARPRQPEDPARDRRAAAAPPAARATGGRRGDEVMMTASWVPMMAAMMLPVAAPAIVRRARADDGALAAPLFAGAYLGIWLLAGLAVYALYRPPGTVVAAALVVAGVLYALTPF